jgi:hypothetical protein
MFLLPDGTTLTDICTENTDGREVGFHPPVLLAANAETAPACPNFIFYESTKIATGIIHFCGLQVKILSFF